MANLNKSKLIEGNEMSHALEKVSHIFKLDYDKKFNNKFVGIQIGVKGVKCITKAIIDCKFKDAKNDQYAYYCKLKNAYESAGKKVEFGQPIILDNGYNVFTAIIGKMKIKFFSPDLLEHQTIIELINFLKNECHENGTSGNGESNGDEEDFDSSEDAGIAEEDKEQRKQIYEYFNNPKP